MRQAPNAEGFNPVGPAGLTAAVYAAREVARRTSEGVFVLIFPDGGDRYLSSGLYRRKF